MSHVALPFFGTRPLVERVVDSLREKIMSAAYGAEGELPPQSDLCRELGVSRTVVREAMQRLQSQGLIEISQGRRPRIRPAGHGAIAESIQVLMRRTDASLLHLAEVRLPLEAEIAARAAQRITSEALEALRRAVTDLQAAPCAASQIEADVRFHRILAEASGNPLFVYVLDALAELLHASRRETIGFGGVEPALQGHRQILAAVENRDPEAARCAMQDHLRASLRDVECVLERQRNVSLAASRAESE